MFDLIKSRAENLLPRLRSTPGRFPYAIAAVAAFLAIGTPWRDDGLGVWYIGLASMFFWSIALRLAVEAVAARNVMLQNAIPAISAAALIPAVGFANAYWVIHLSPAAAGVLAVIAVPLFSPAGGRTRNAWSLGVLESAAISAIRSALILVGVGSLSGAIDALANTNIFESLFDRPLWIVCVSTMAFSFLSLSPSLRDEGGEPPIAKWFTGLVEFFLAPSAIAFLVIVNAYCLHTLWFWAVPKGVIAILVISYAVLGGVVWSLAYSIGGGERSFTRILKRFFPPGLGGPSIALLIAVAARIDEHGVTEGRYLLVVIGSVLAALGIGQLVTRRAIGPHHVAALLSVSLLASTLGPWSAVEVSLRSQTARLWDALERAHVLKNGFVVPQQVGIPPNEWNNIRSKVFFLVEHGRIEAILSLFENRPELPKETEPNRLAAFLVSKMGVETSDGNLVTFDADHSYSASVSGFSRIMSGFVNPNKTAEFDYDPNKVSIEVGDGDGMLLLRLNGKPSARFDIGNILRDPPRSGGEPVRLDAVGADGEKVRLLVLNAWGRVRSQGEVTIQTVTFNLLLEERPSPP